MLTDNQKKLIDQLTAEFESINQPPAPAENPLINVGNLIAKAKRRQAIKKLEEEQKEFAYQSTKKEIQRIIDMLEKDLSMLVVNPSIAPPHVWIYVPKHINGESINIIPEPIYEELVAEDGDKYKVFTHKFQYVILDKNGLRPSYKTLDELIQGEVFVKKLDILLLRADLK